MKKVIRFVKTLLTLVMVYVLSVSLVFADELPDLSKSGDISVTIKRLDTKEAVSGGEMALYKIADVKVDNGFVFSYTEVFAGLGNAPASSEDFTSELAKQAALLAESAEPVVTETIAADGTVKFTGLPLGLYLLVETKAEEGLEVIDPFMVTLPYKNEAGEWIYSVDAAPKPGMSKPIEKPIPDELPLTGLLWWPAGLLAVCGIVLIGAGIVLRTKRNA